MVVHHVKVNPVGSGIDDVTDFFAETGKVRGKNRGGDETRAFFRKLCDRHSGWGSVRN